MTSSGEIKLLSLSASALLHLRKCHMQYLSVHQDNLFPPTMRQNKKDFFPCSSYRINISSCLVKHWPFCFLSQGLLSDTGE
uniref:Uncharacterized protein n=1 Tax=Anguilla anguilla TaxID=7936 RepID=A0A0E9UAB6_ANGAN